MRACGLPDEHCCKLADTALNADTVAWPSVKNFTTMLRQARGGSRGRERNGEACNAFESVPRFLAALPLYPSPSPSCLAQVSHHIVPKDLLVVVFAGHSAPSPQNPLVLTDGKAEGTAHLVPIPSLKRLR